jgi:TrmH family RNA methyltransferase
MLRAFFAIENGSRSSIRMAAGSRARLTLTLAAWLCSISKSARPTLTSQKNPLVKALRRLESRRHRERDGLILLEGLRLVTDALDAGFQPETVLVAEALLAQHAELGRALGALPPRVVSLADEAVLAAACTTVSPQGIVAAVRMPPLVAHVPAGATLVLVLDNVSDPGNVGTLVRGAAGFGCDAVVSLGACADVWSPKALRSAMGGTFRVPHVAAAEWAELRASLEEHDFAIHAAEGGFGACDYGEVDWRRPSAIVVGNEANGLCEEIRADVAAGRIRAVSIPMAARLESLNAAMAGTILLSECARQRRSSR